MIRSRLITNHTSTTIQTDLLFSCKQWVGHFEFDHLFGNGFILIDSLDKAPASSEVVIWTLSCDTVNSNAIYSRCPNVGIYIVLTPSSNIGRNPNKPSIILITFVLQQSGFKSGDVGVGT